MFVPKERGLDWLLSDLTVDVFPGALPAFPPPFAADVLAGVPLPLAPLDVDGWEGAVFPGTCLPPLVPFDVDGLEEALAGESTAFSNDTPPSAGAELEGNVAIHHVRHGQFCSLPQDIV